MMTTQNLTITNLMSELVKRSGSDLHLTGNSIPFFRVQGQIMPADSENFLSEDLRNQLTKILGDEKIAKFDKEKELDCSYGLEGIARFRIREVRCSGKAPSCFGCCYPFAYGGLIYWHHTTFQNS